MRLHGTVQLFRLDSIPHYAHWCNDSSVCAALPMSLYEQSRNISQVALSLLCVAM